MKPSFFAARSFRLTLLGVVLLALGVTACAPKTAVHATNTPELTAEPAAEATEAAAAVTETSPLNLAFPRLGMWWPDPEEQPLADIARYDWVILGPWDDPAHVASLKAIKPDITLLNATNACELSFNADFEVAENAVIREILAEWFLTQVGSTLTADVDAIHAQLPQNALWSDDGAAQ
ncbi:MAG: hypothetical protein HF973_07005 [Chloroflexi bacterium]|nr:hypothetical protein [Chloroflexota bacterium]